MVHICMLGDLPESSMSGRSSTWVNQVKSWGRKLQAEIAESTKACSRRECGESKEQGKGSSAQSTASHVGPQQRGSWTREASGSFS